VSVSRRMPFLSQDWRGPGEDWVRGQDGWEILKPGEPRDSGDSVRRRRSKTEGDKDKENTAPARLGRHRSLPSLQPFCPIIIKCTREVAGFNSLADVLKRLDFTSAVRDIRRFQYVSSLLQLLLTPDRLHQLSGASQKLVLRLLEEMAGTVFAEQRNEPVLRRLVQDLHSSMDTRAVWGSHLGSETLLRSHTKSRRRIACITAVEKRKSEVERENREEGEDMEMDELPEECVREILCRLSDCKDLDSAGKASPVMGFIVKEKRIWRELVQAHFNKNEIEFILKKRPELAEKKNWRDLYIATKKQFGLRPQFTELLMLCKPCRVLYWQSYGHPGCPLDPCSTSQSTSSSPSSMLPISPTTFLTFFSI